MYVCKYLHVCECMCDVHMYGVKEKLIYVNVLQEYVLLGQQFVYMNDVLIDQNSYGRKIKKCITYICLECLLSLMSD